MKIGILTQPLHCNYGGILQNYALQTVLKRMGHDVWTIDYRTYTWLDWLDNAWRVLAHKMLGHKTHFALTPVERSKKEWPLRRFAVEHMELTSPRIKRINGRLVDKYAFDAILVGSDQVWRPMYNDPIQQCFLDFLGDRKQKRVAYAASFGTDKWEYTDGQTRVCAGLARRFDGISVREKSGVDLCREHLGVDAVHVLDPTLLLDATDYKKLCEKIPKRSPFVFAYILDGNEAKRKQISDFAASNGLPYVIKSADAQVSPDDSIELWLSCFRDAAYVVTDSFHGTAFSIIFNRDFYVYGNEGRGNSRFDSLLGMLRLKERIVGENAPLDGSKVDWQGVNKTRKEEAERSMEWIGEELR